MKIGTDVEHPIYGKGRTVSEPETHESVQWSGTAIWCVFYRPQSGIAAGWAYLVPVSDLLESPK